MAATSHGALGTSFVVTAAGAFAVGDLIVVCISSGTTLGAQSILNVTDQLGNVYNSFTNGSKSYNAGSGGGASSAIGAVYLAVCTVAGTPQVTVQVQQASYWGYALAIDGFTGAASSIDVSATPATGAAGTTPVSNSTGATTNGNELVFAVYFDQGGGDSLAVVSGYTAGPLVSSTNDNNLILMYKDSGAIGSTPNAGNPISGGGTANQPWAYLVFVVKPSTVQAAEAATVVDAASVSIPSSTTPQTSDAARVTDFALVTVVGDAPLPPGFGRAVAPSWASWQPIPGRYTFYFARLDTNALIMTLPLSGGVQWTNLINQPGNFQAHLPLGDRTIIPDPDAALNATLPEQTVVYVDKGGSIVAHAVILTRNHDFATDTLEIAGQDLLWEFGRRIISDNLSYNEDMLQIARDLVTYTQAKPNGNLGIVVDNSVRSGITLVRNYGAAQGTQAAGSGSADSSNILQAITNLAALNPGFEFRVRAHWVSGVPQRSLELAFQHFGVPSSLTNLVWGFPNGAITDFSWQEDGTQTVRQEFVLGSQQTSGVRPFAVSAATPGYPLTQETLSASVADQSSLQQIADAQQALKANPKTLPHVIVYGPVDPLYGTYQEGDHARYRVRAKTSGRFWGGMDSVWRIVGLQVALNEDGSEKVTHLLAPAAF